MEQKERWKQRWLVAENRAVRGQHQPSDCHQNQICFCVYWRHSAFSQRTEINATSTVEKLAHCGRCTNMKNYILIRILRGGLKFQFNRLSHLVVHLGQASETQHRIKQSCGDVNHWFESSCCKTSSSLFKRSMWIVNNGSNSKLLLSLESIYRDHVEQSK